MRFPEGTVQAEMVWFSFIKTSLVMEIHGSGKSGNPLARYSYTSTRQTQIADHERSKVLIWAHYFLNQYCEKEKPERQKDRKTERNSDWREKGAKLLYSMIVHSVQGDLLSGVIRQKRGVPRLRALQNGPVAIFTWTHALGEHRPNCRRSSQITSSAVLIHFSSFRSHFQDSNFSVIW